MADPKKRLQTNIAGEFFVDSTCINCDTCRQLAPTVFGEEDGYSRVRRQPENQIDERASIRALLACPTGSIGTIHANNAREVIADFPLKIVDNVYYCGFNSPKSYGGNSYFIFDKNGNWLVDAPRFVPQLVSKFEKMGGISRIFLTHRDDVADARRYADYFGASCIIHRRDLSALPDAETVVDGNDDMVFAEDFVIVPTPGHTAGHCVLLYLDTFLFTGDHMAWSRDDNALEAWPDVCWYSWDEQKQSIRRLENHKFEWVLPGHGDRVHLSAPQMQKKLGELIEYIEA